jgi:hypothetical protein
MWLIHLIILPGLSESNPTLGWRRVVLLVEASFNPDFGKKINHTRSLEAFCSQNGIRLTLMNSTSGFGKPTAALPTPITSPLFTGSFPSSPLLYSPDGTQRHGPDHVPLLSLDGHPITKSSPPTSPVKSWQPSGHVRSLYDKLQNMPQVGVIHLALQNDSTGSILRYCFYLLFSEITIYIPAFCLCDAKLTIAAGRMMYL